MQENRDRDRDAEWRLLLLVLEGSTASRLLRYQTLSGVKVSLQERKPTPVYPLASFRR